MRSASYRVMYTATLSRHVDAKVCTSAPRTCDHRVTSGGCFKPALSLSWIHRLTSTVDRYHVQKLLIHRDPKNRPLPQGHFYFLQYV